MIKIISLAAAMLLTATAVQATVSDDFNRPDASTLGTNWTTRAGTVKISGNQAVGTSGSYATYNGASSSFVSFDISQPGGGVSYVAGVLGFGGGSDAFVKVQDNGGGQFDAYAFYTGNNGGGFFGSLTSAFDTAHVEITLVGALATLTITPNIGGIQTYTNTYGSAFSGTGVGLGFYGNGHADNFSTAAAAAVPEPASWGLMIVGFGLVGAAARRRAVALAA